MFCRSCKTSLELDSSLEDIDSSVYRQLIDSLPSAPCLSGKSLELPRPLYTEDRKKVFDVASGEARDPIFSQSSLSDCAILGHRHRLPPKGTKDQQVMSFIMLSDSQIRKPADHNVIIAEADREASGEQLAIGSHKRVFAHENLLSTKMQASNKLFESLSSRSDINHPICTDCTMILTQEMEKRLASIMREQEVFSEFLTDAHADVPTDDERRRAEEELNEIKIQQLSMIHELENLEAEKCLLEENIAKIEEEFRKLNDEEENFWHERNQMTQIVSTLQNERESVNVRYDYDSRQLERLQRTNVYNDTFCISHDGAFATINGLRLGRTNPPTVDWPEINAAWGYMCLLLATVAEKLAYTFKEYRLVPMGSTSVVEKLGGSQRLSDMEVSGNDKVIVLPLYHSGELPLSLGFLIRNFNNGMVAFLQCLRELGLHLEHTTHEESSPESRIVGLRLPYVIDRDKIHNCSIMIATFNGGEENWTKACKCTLTCCKFLLAHVSNVQVVQAKIT